MSDQINDNWGVPDSKPSVTASDVQHQPKDVQSKEWHLIEKVLLAGQKEQVSARRWGIFFKALTFFYLFLMLMLFWPKQMVEQAVGEDHVGLIELNGPIMDEEPSSADNLVQGLRSAFEAKHATAIIIKINSPGGSAVQSQIVYNEIQRLKKATGKKVYAVISDLGASGAYYIASSADEIYANPASLVGSIGVISEGFGFVGLLDKLSIERRVFTAGENKAIMDPFSDLRPEQTLHIQSILKEIHQEFIRDVKAGRGDKLSQDPKVFSGLFWSGRQAKELGLIDGFASAGSLAREKLNTDQFHDYSVQDDPFEKLMKSFGVSMGLGVMQAIGVQNQTNQINPILAQ